MTTKTTKKEIAVMIAIVILTFSVTFLPLILPLFFEVKPLEVAAVSISCSMLVGAVSLFLVEL